MKSFRIVIKTVLFFALAICATLAGSAQSTTGSIYGAVADSGGAAVPNSTVTAKDVETGAVLTTTTNGSGEYVFSNVKPGNYVVAGTAEGFKTQNQTGIVVAANQNVHVTFSLEVGATTETVDVTAATTLVDTRGSALAETVETQRIQDLPTLDRNAYDLVQTVPGITSYTGDKQTGTRNGAIFVTNGLPGDMASFYLDGAYNNTYKQGGGNKSPNPDAIQEFRILTSNFDAEFGRSPGAAVNVITRSGTNKYHGSAYEYIRNDLFNSQRYFTKQGTPRQPYKQNQFGGTIGGPIKRDSLFAFLSYEQFIFHTVAQVTPKDVTLPNDAERSGNLVGSKFAPTKVVVGLTNCGAAGVPTLCTSQLDPVAQKLLTFVPHLLPDGTAPQQIAAANTKSSQGLGRIDYSGFKNHSIEAMYFQTVGDDVAPLAGGNQIVGYSGMTETENLFNGVVADTWTVNARAVNSFRGFYTLNKYVIDNQYGDHFLANLGSQAHEGGAIAAPPKFNLNGLFSAGPSGAGPSNITQSSYGVMDTLTLNRGHHQLKFGGSYVWNRYNEDGGNVAGGTFAFTGGTTGSVFADFLLGRANTLAQSSSVFHRTHQYDPALYAQDDWQISNRLTLNLGLRWEMFPPHCCEPQIQGTFIAGQQSTVIPTAPVGIVYMGDKNVAPGIFNTQLTNFSPRVGFAYDAYGNGKTSLRGGFGMFYQTIEQFNSGTMNQLPFSLNTTVNLTPNLVTPYSTFPGGDPYPFVYNPSAPRFASGATTQSARPNTGTPYVYEYNFTLEQQLSSAFAFRLGYVGNATRKNLINLDANAPIYFAGAATGTNALNCRRPYQPNRTGGPVNSATCLLSTAYAFSAINQRTPALNANYNSLQVSLRGRIGTRFNMLTSYVWSKSLDYAAPTVDNYDLHKNYGPSDYDLRHRFVVSYTLALPSPALWGAFGRQALGGWHINQVTTLQSGNPFTITSGQDTNLDGTNNDRVNITGDPYSHAKTRFQKINNFYNLAAFSVPTNPSTPYGNESKNQLYGPGNVNTNLSLFKDFALYEALKLQIRAEAYNAYGNVNLNNPRTNFNVFNNLPAGNTMITDTGDPRRFQFAAKLLF